MVASQSGVQEPHNDMYCSAIPNPYGEYYPDYYIPPHHLHHAHQQELCPQPHGPMCTLHTDYCPVTVPMVSTNSSPPIAMPVQVPPGHVVQQIVDESGTLRHVILSPQPPIVPIPPPHGHNQQHYVPGPGNGSNQPPQPYFAQGLPPGYPHFSLPPAHLGHGPPPGSQHPGHSPPPPPSAANFHKDERTQRQYIKLKRKLEQKQLRVGSTATGRTGGNAAAHSMLATTASPRRDTLVNGLRRGGAGGNGNARHERGMSSVGTSEDGEESSSVQDDDDDANIIVEILSSVQAPQVSDLSSRSALIQWSIPPRLPEASNNDYEISEADLRYEVLLSSDKGKEGKYKSIYNGSSLSCRIQDLKPGQEYSVCLQVHMDELQGSPSELLIFKTPPCEPDQPQPPKLISRNRTSLQLRWNAATDNGSHILHYILEFDEGKGGEFVELSKGKGKQNNLQKLQSSTCYKFRLAAVNEFGKSAYSDIVAFSTSGSPPAQPTAPTLKEASVTSLHLTWQKRPNDDDFTLQMDDGLSRHGFLPVFNGKETEYVCEGLRRASEFKFRLKAHNEEGPSRWSEEVCFRTLPDRPSRPHKLGVKGKIHAHQFRVKWDPPNDDGGSDITAYILEIDSGAGYAKAYVGNDTETTCDRLIPGTTYRLRVYCASDGGESDRSEPCVVTTEPVCPGKCRPPRIIGRPKADSMTVTWSAPDFDGGSPITEYELDLIEQDRNRRSAYRGLETECLVDRLKPGTPYTFVVRASNRTGVGAWSEEIVAVSGAAAPDAPLAPEVSAKSPFHVHVRWREPNCNGAAVSEYRLEIGSGGIRDESFSPIFQGGSTGYEVKGLAPATAYFFRVQACNAAGCGAYSPVTATVTPPSAPSVVLLPKYESTPTSITLMWSTPSDNGSEILHYNIEIGDKSISTETVLNEFSLRNLHPDTVYKIKIQAVNSVGNGPFSPVLRAVTPPLPPAPPKLECVNVGHNYIKLKWGEGKNPDFTRYCVEMDNPRAKEFQCVYVGTSYTCKVNKLQELTEYRFRISAANDAAGQGDVSTVHVFKTSIAPPAGLRAPKVIDVGQKSCSLEWGPCKITSGDPIVYSVQMTRVRDQDFKQVYRGSETKCTVSDLEAGAEYSARVCPIRLAQSGELRGAHSPVCNFTTAPADLASTGRRTSTTCLPTMNGSPARGRRNRRFLSWLPCMGTDDRQSSDRQKAILILIGFASFAILAAVLVEQFIIWRQSV